MKFQPVLALPQQRRVRLRTAVAAKDKTQDSSNAGCAGKDGVAEAGEDHPA